MLAKSPGSIAELNIVGHGNKNYLGLAGKITPTAHGVDVDFTSWMDIGDFETERIRRIDLEAAKTQTVPEDPESMANRFAPGAAINIYACHAGGGFAFGESLAKALCVTVRAFSRTIGYCPDIADNRSRITDRSWVAIGDSCEGRTRGFTSLLGQFGQVGPNKPKKPALDLSGDLSDL
ncbi:hypothetical protein G6O69_15860 [Pseudenhygromyxa sp. WMMC2535]|uniref:hypothetical protein n=1 Tax=Pseudenhygromyxa sp. WMMC2535 TaxID=2712867 RepID=UPI001595882F|nr:hypothetical protein [Pseudenhygromyxa sp. WMMC2535]NVB39319.1 hypothetical protein [Pseudenhygromyxa sp. WMMC2535]